MRCDACAFGRVRVDSAFFTMAPKQKQSIKELKVQAAKREAQLDVLEDKQELLEILKKVKVLVITFNEMYEINDEITKKVVADIDHFKFSLGLFLQ